ncbi:hypothetical protein Poly21_57330 [Allorhodopirellula heiligendammensis]|uniref:Uncharacterized protein n=1 Tax=Allorhodopirellula heiligendammensis TaxID=2714739 RepID=A0A5C6B4E7_9BACT|nr:hypothetical protein Poly21_57330 [Allorhodopirellula heiligendammensis]
MSFQGKELAKTTCHSRPTPDQFLVFPVEKEKEKEGNGAEGQLNDPQPV